MKKKTEVYILGGFLGSGKTTLLKQIIEQENMEGRRAAVLMNELGSVSIDSDAVSGEVPLKELVGGCICCTIQDKLEAQLQELLHEYEPEAVYIETTGAAHPVEVLDAIMSPLFADQFIYKGIITVVDLLRWKDRDQLPPQLRHLLTEQIQHADLILLNKQDLVSEQEAAGLLYTVQSLNPAGTFVLTSHSKVPAKVIREMKYHENKGHQKADVHAHLHLQAVVHTFKGAVMRKEFEEWLRSMPETVYRIKGYIRFSDSSFPDLFQYSYGMPLFMPEIMQMPLNMVIIGEGLDEKLIHARLTELETGAK